MKNGWPGADSQRCYPVFGVYKEGLTSLRASIESYAERESHVPPAICRSQDAGSRLEHGVVLSEIIRRAFVNLE